jgi:hypothetical protein
MVDDDSLRAAQLSGGIFLLRSEGLIPHQLVRMHLNQSLTRREQTHLGFRAALGVCARTRLSILVDECRIAGRRAPQGYCFSDMLRC